MLSNNTALEEIEALCARGKLSALLRMAVSDLDAFVKAGGTPHMGTWFRHVDEYFDPDTIKTDQCVACLAGAVWWRAAGGLNHKNVPKLPDNIPVWMLTLDELRTFNVTKAALLAASATEHPNRFTYDRVQTALARLRKSYSIKHQPFDGDALQFLAPPEVYLQLAADLEKLGL